MYGVVEFTEPLYIHSDIGRRREPYLVVVFQTCVLVEQGGLADAPDPR